MSVRKSVPVHLQDGQEFTNPLGKLLKFGKSLFMANWTIEEGADDRRLKEQARRFRTRAVPC